MRPHIRLCHAERGFLADKKAITLESALAALYFETCWIYLHIFYLSVDRIPVVEKLIIFSMYNIF